MDTSQVKKALGDFLTFGKGFKIQATPTGKLVALRDIGTATRDIFFQVQTNSTVLERFFGRSLSLVDSDGLPTPAAAVAALPGVQSAVDALSLAKVASEYQSSQWGNPWPGDFGDPEDATFSNGSIGIPAVGWSYSYKISGLGVIDGGGGSPLSYNAECAQQAVKLRATIFMRGSVPMRAKISYVNQVYFQEMQGGLTSPGNPFSNVLSRTLVSETPGELEIYIGLLGYNSFEMPLTDIVTAPWPVVTMPVTSPTYYLINNNMLQHALLITNVEEV